jgi:amino acid adenylation domain-containing protein
VSKQIIEDENIKIKDIGITSEEEKIELINLFNETKVQYEKYKTIYELFEEQVEKTPYEVALSFEDEILTYKELNEKSNKLARLLREKGVRANTIVGIMLEASKEMIIGIMGILKAGGAYLPIDPNYPEERKKYMLSDSGAEILLIKNIEDVNFEKEIICINEELTNYSSENLERLSSPEDLVYIIYTSGSTGAPKGVMIKQKGLVNYITWANKSYVKGDKLDFPLYSSFSFDLTVTSIFTPLITGNSIVVYKDNDNDILIRRVFKENKVGIVKLTPAHLSLIKDMDNRNSSIKRLIVGGEDLKSQLAKEIFESFNKNIEIYNEYGPTETVVGCMIYKYDYENDKNISVPIGKPADNTQIYILDGNLNTVPFGVIGELHIGGEGVAKGYLNKPELTDKSFIENLFNKGEKLYKTGDTARFLLDGNVEYLDRTDNQVKIRGYRIETGEIEDKLLKNRNIKEAIVIARGDKNNNKYLCAYIVVDSEDKNKILTEVRESLKKELPNYMMPSYFVKLDKLPLTTNGKVDRTLLPKPNINIITEAKYEEPRNELEETLVSIWEDILRIKGIGINSNLFELGANSINIISFISKLSVKLKYRIPFKNIFENQTIKSLSSFIENTNDILKDSITDYVQLTKSDENNKVIFCFPPVASLAIGYMKFAEYLEGYSVHSFNFIKSENRFKEYVKLMREIQPKGPYILIGYSSGGNLAFDVAKELNKQGCEVSDVILIDSRFRTEIEPHVMTEEEWKKAMYEKYKLEQYDESETLVSDYAIDMIMSYLKYVDDSKTIGTIGGNISFINSEKEFNDARMFKWGEVTNKEFKIIQGFGIHLEMITSLDTNIIKNNADIVNEILVNR